MYYDEYIECSTFIVNEKIKQIELNKNDKRYSKIVCVNTGELFKNVTTASQFYNICRKGIVKSCKNYNKSCGEKDGNPLFWMYYDEYIKIDKESYLEKRMNNYKPKEVKVICLNTMEVFDSISQAGKIYNVNPANISSVCCNKAISCGIIGGSPGLWMYYSDYKLMSENELNNYFIEKEIQLKNRNKHGSKKIICINTGEIFESMVEAEIKYNIPKGSISKVCRKKQCYAGVVNGAPGEWSYYNYCN